MWLWICQHMLQGGCGYDGGVERKVRRESEEETLEEKNCEGARFGSQAGRRLS
jgi:hypothetical protein